MRKRRRIYRTYNLISSNLLRICLGLLGVLALVIMISAIVLQSKTQSPKVLPQIESISEGAQAYDPDNSQGIKIITDSEFGEKDEDAEETVEELTVDMTKVKAFDEAKTMYAVSNVNIRKGPDTAFESVGMIKLGDSVEIIGQDEGGWYEFMYRDEIVFACDDYLSDEEPVIADDAEVAAKVAEDEEAASKAAEEMASAVEEAEKQPVDPADVLIIGDSRSVMMRNATGGGGCNWICQNSKGYKWLVSTALPEAEELIGNGTKVVIALGVNDVGNVNRYAALINEKAKEWADKGATTYYVSVNPVTDNARVSEASVQFFNSTISGNLTGVKWINTHDYLMSDGFNATDGVHYDNATSKKIYQAIMGSL